MNEKNLDYLKRQLFYLGFGEKLNQVLETAISRELPKFKLGVSNTQRPLENPDRNAPRTDHISYELNFNRGKDSDVYYLNDYLVTLHKAGESVPRSQTFDLQRDHQITALQAYKLLSGLSFEKEVSLNKEGEKADQKTPMWFRLNLDVTDAYGNHPLRKMRPEYSYDVAAALDKYPFKFPNEAEKAEAVKTLATGNYYHGVLNMSNKGVGVLIAANPQMKTVDIYDHQLKEIRDADIWPEKAAARTTHVQQPGADALSQSQEFDHAEQEESLEQGAKVGR